MQLSFQGEYFLKIETNICLYLKVVSIFTAFNSLMQTLEHSIVIKSDLQELDSRFLEKVTCQSKKKSNPEY